MKSTFAAAGDCFITRRIHSDSRGFKELQALIRAQNVRFANLEMTFHNQEGYPAAASGGTWAMTSPDRLDDMLGYGFNLFATANNHSGDYGQGGVAATLKHLTERGMCFAGTGLSLQQAARAAYLDGPEGRTALIAVTATFDPAAVAGSQGGLVSGRPGLNPLRHENIHHVNAHHFEMVKELADTTLANAKALLSIRNGYRNPFATDTMPLGNLNFKLTEREEFNETRPNKKDLERTVSEIVEARRQADWVLVSLHAHEMRAQDSREPAQFVETFARACIDAGADAVIGHGPHELRGIEIYKGRPIFYSLGNFIFQTETIAEQPADAFTAKGMSVDTKIGEYMAQRSANGTRGYGVQENIWRSVLPVWEMQDGRLVSLRLYPISLGMHEPRSRKGTPELTRDEAVLEYISELSRPYGTNITIAETIGEVILS